MEQPQTPATAPVPGNNRTPARNDGGWRRFYLWAGIASILFVVLLILAVVLDLLAPPPVDDGAETLQFIARNKVTYTAEQLLWTVPNILPVLVFLALFMALSPLDRSLSLLAAVVGGLSWALILAVPVTSRGSTVLVYLSDRYAAAPDDVARQRYSTAAEAIIAENNTPAAVGVLSALGILLICLVMLKGVMPRPVAWLGVVTGICGVAAEALRHAVPGFYGVYGVLMWAWFIAVGIALLRLARLPRRPSAPPQPN